VCRAADFILARAFSDMVEEEDNALAIIFGYIIGYPLVSRDTLDRGLQGCVVWSHVDMESWGGGHISW
jgi:hypothetical protein